MVGLFVAGCATAPTMTVTRAVPADFPLPAPEGWVEGVLDVQLMGLRGTAVRYRLADGVVGSLEPYEAVMRGQRMAITRRDGWGEAGLMGVRRGTQTWTASLSERPDGQRLQLVVVGHNR